MNINTLKKTIFSKTSLDALIVLFSSGLSSSIGFVFVSIVARKMGPEEFGIFNTIVYYAVFLSAVVDLGVTQSLVHFVKRKHSNQENKIWISTSFISVLFSSSIFAILTSVIYFFYLSKIWHHNPNNVIFIFLMVFFVTITMFFMGLFQSLGKFIQRSIIDNIFSISRIIILFILIFLGILNFNWAMLSIILAYIITVVVGFIMVREFLNIKSVVLARIKKIFIFSKWLALVNIFANLYGKIDVMMLAAFSTAYTTGIYSSAARFILIFPLIVSSLSAVVSPRYSQFEKIQDVHKYFKQIVLLALIVSGVMALMIILAKYIILIAYSDQFFDSITVFRWLVIANLPLVLSIPATNAIVYFFKKPNLITYISFFQLIGLVLLNIILIKKYDIFGPIFSLLIMNSLGMLFQYGIYFKLRRLII